MFHDVTMIWEKLFKLISNCANVLCPYKNIKIRVDNPPWITQEIRKNKMNYYMMG